MNKIKNIPSLFDIKLKLFEYQRSVLKLDFDAAFEPVNIHKFADWYNEVNPFKSIEFLDWNHPDIEIFKKQLFNIYLKDFELVDDHISRKKYEPVILDFECHSGKIIVDDWFGGMSREPYDDCYDDIGITSGIIKTMKNFHKHKILHGFVGNSCPSLYWDSKDEVLEVGTIYNSPEDDFIEPEPINKNLVNVGGVCTDLWWYAIMDFDDYVTAGGDPNYDNWTNNIIEIPKGKYQLEHYYSISVQGYHPNQPYAILKKIK